MRSVYAPDAATMFTITVNIAIRLRYPMTSNLEDLALKYTVARNIARLMQYQNDIESRNAHTMLVGGQTHHTPAAIVNAVKAYKDAAIALAEEYSKTMVG